MKQFCFLLLMPLLLCIPGGAALAQHHYLGTVRSVDGGALGGVTVHSNSRQLAVTDSAGNYAFEDSAARLTLSFRHNSFQTQQGLFTPNQRALIFMAPSATLLPEAVVKAFESNTSLRNTPASVSLLTSRDLQRFNESNILAAVNTVPGVKMDERSPGSYRLSIRGNLLRSPFGVRNVKVYWNGIPFTDANGNTYLNQLGFSNVGSLEIIKGPGGSMYGAGTGGVVLLNSQQLAEEENSLFINSLAGSYGLLETGVASRRSTEASSSQLQYTHQQSDGWRRQTSMRKDVANYSGNFRISSRQAISANVFYSDLFYETPGGLTAAQQATDPRQARPAGAFPSAEEQQAALYVKTMYAGLSQTLQLGTAWSNTTGVYVAHTRFRNPSILNYQRKTEQGTGGRSVFNFERGKWQVHVGGEYQYAFTSTRTFGNRSGIADTLQFDDEIAATQYNLFSQAAIRFSTGTTVQGGVSYNNYGYGFTRLNQLPASEVRRNFEPVFVPRLAVLQSLGKRLNLYVTVSKGFSPPTIDEIVPSTGIFNAGLQAETAVNYEVGVKGDLVPGRLTVDLSAYRLRLGNTIVTRRDAAGADYFVNTGKTDQRGLEVAVRYWMLNKATGFVLGITWWGNYTYIHARFEGYQQGNTDFTAKRLTGTPPHVVVGGLDVTTAPGIYLHLTYNYTDLVPLNDANTFYGSQYQLLMGRLGYRHKFVNGFELDAYTTYDRSFNNPYGLGNDLNAAGNRYYNPSAPENFSVGVKLGYHFRKERSQQPQ